MKKKFYLLILIALHTSVFAGFINDTMRHQNRVRKYRIYVPDVYTNAPKKVPLVIGLHGFGDNVDDFSGICMSAVADTANYIAVYPEATPDPVLSGFFGPDATAWNSGASTGIIVINNGVDDKGFINRVIDTMIARYMIDTTRMYMFGFSFGAFMTDRMATECSTRFAAVANVSGLHGNSVTALPQVPVPYLKFHGTSDQTIGYYGTSTLGFFPGLGMSAESTVKFWVKQNHCDTTPVIDSMPNIANDGLRFVRFSYNHGTDDMQTIFYKVINGMHSWYGLPTNDISYCQTIWSFLRQYSRRPMVTGIGVRSHTQHFKIYPNPSGGATTIDFAGISGQPVALNVYNISGDLIQSVSVKNETQISLQQKLASGIYLIQLNGESGVIATEKIVVQ